MQYKKEKMKIALSKMQQKEYWKIEGWASDSRISINKRVTVPSRSAPEMPFSSRGDTAWFLLTKQHLETTDTKKIKK